MTGHYVGVDVGGTKSAAVVVDETGATIAEDWHEHGGTAVTPLPEIVLGSVARVVSAAGLAPGDPAAYGVAVAGLVGGDRSTLVHAAKLGVRRLDLGAALRERLAGPVVVENDANATLYGHRARSAPAPAPTADERDVVLLLTLGTGTGGAILAGGRPLVGAHGFAGELGHVLVDPDDPRRCLCGAPGCVENYASGRGIGELAALCPAPAASRALLGVDDGHVIASPEVVALAERGDAWAIGLLERAGRMLGRALTVLCITLDPGEVVIAGSFGHAAQRWLLPAARAEMTSRWPFVSERAVPELAVDTIGPYAAATGAALLSRALTPTETP
jgi:glucokinase